MEEFKFNQTVEEITINNEKITVIFNKNGITVKPKKENKTLEELKQKTINHLYDSVFVDSNEVNLLKLLLEKEKD
mgnify:CR=1 FL=1